MRTLDVLRTFLYATALPLAACNGASPSTAPPARVATATATRVDFGVPEKAEPVAVVAPVVEPSTPTPPDLVKQARAALDANDLDRAAALATQAVLETPQRSVAWNTLGRVQLRRGQGDAGLDSFEQAVEANPSSAWARNNFGLALIYHERYAEAVAQLEEATDILPSSGLMWNNLGLAYEHVDRIDEARDAYRQAMERDNQGATRNFVRLEGVKSLRHTAQLEPEEPAVDTGL